MRLTPNDPPRRYEVGFGDRVTIEDVGRVELAADEQLTFVTEAGSEYDLARKDWGFYATPSLNGRLVDHGLHALLVRNRLGRYFVVLVERGKEPLFERYVTSEQLTVVRRLDSTQTLDELAEHP